MANTLALRASHRQSPHVARLFHYIRPSQTGGIMRRFTLVLSMLGLLGVSAVAAQTRARVSLGFGGPDVSGYVVVGHPWHFSPYRRSLVLVRPYGPPRRVVIVRRPG